MSRKYSRAMPDAVRRQVDAARAGMAALETPQEQPPSSVAVQQQAPHVVQQPEQPNQDPPQKQATDFERKFHSVNGQLMHERTVHANEVTALRTEVGDLKARLEQMAQVPNQTQNSKTKTTEVSVADYFSEDEIERVGPDLLSKLLNAAVSVSQRSADSLAGRVEKLDQQIGPIATTQRQQAETAKERRWREFTSEVAKSVPDWERINVMPEFSSWLTENFDGTTLPRKVILDEAVKSADHNAAAGLFVRFKREFGIVTATDSPRRSPVPAGGASAGDATHERNQAAHGDPEITPEFIAKWPQIKSRMTRQQRVQQAAFIQRTDARVRQSIFGASA